MENIRKFIDMVKESNNVLEPTQQERNAIKALIGEAYTKLDTIKDLQQKKYYKEVHRAIFSLLKSLDHTEAVLFLWYFYNGFTAEGIANEKLKGKYKVEQIKEIVHRIYSHMLADSKIKELIVKHME